MHRFDKEGAKPGDDSTQDVESLGLIFTHGAGGTLTSDAIANFAAGFAGHFPIICFQGNMNLKSRAKMFSEVMKHQDYSHCLGGRSMGARAAVMAATKDTEVLILESYPLHTATELRDQILLDLQSSINVLFIVGDKDNMCDLSRLKSVRQKMKCPTWLVIVEGADHGMNISPKSATTEMGIKRGEVAAEWRQIRDSGRRKGRIYWDGEAKWGGFDSDLASETETHVSPTKSQTINKQPKAKRKAENSSTPETREDEAVSSRTRKRRRI